MSSNETPKTVLLSGDPVQYEGTAGEAITPGHVVLYDGGEVEPGAAETLRVARERDFIGEGISSEIPSGDNVPYYVARKGDRFYCVMADAETLSAGDKVEANASGEIIEADTGVTIGVAVEDGDSDNDRIKVEAL